MGNCHFLIDFYSLFRKAAQMEQLYKYQIDQLSFHRLHFIFAQSGPISEGKKRSVWKKLQKKKKKDVKWYKETFDKRCIL